jgi:DnaK suppressor protein
MAPRHVIRLRPGSNRNGDATQMPAKEQRAEGSAWGTKELQHFEGRLADERKRALVQMGKFDEQLGSSLEAATGELTMWRFHMADIGSDMFEREQNFLFATREGQLLWHIDEALRRLYRSPETFGVCEGCGTRIAFERLDAIPYVPRCVGCKQDWESGRGSKHGSERGSEQ